MKVVVTGSSGLVGTALVTFLEARDVEIFRLVRSSTSSAREIYWQPTQDSLDVQSLEDVDAVVHLAGESIAGRWSKAKKEAIRESRVKGTLLLSNALAKLKKPPRVFICASAIGYYGNRDNEVLTEESGPGDDFLAKVVVDWEGATAVAQRAGIRVVNLRIGVVLSRKGGALQKMLLPFKLGAGGVVGSGRQYWSWIALTDLVQIIDFLLSQSTVSGAVNAVAPNSSTNKEFTKALGAALSRPTIVPMPGAIAKLVFGEMAEALLLASAKVLPARLQESGYTFLHSDLKSALRTIVSE